jgi:hypothetical protein
MESMQLATQLLIHENMRHMTAFSALPNAPVQPVRDRRRGVRRTIDAIGRRSAGSAPRRLTFRQPLAT